MRSTIAGTVCSTLHGFHKINIRICISFLTRCKRTRNKVVSSILRMRMASELDDQAARPPCSCALEKHNEHDVLHMQLLVGPKVCDVVRCSDCNKPMCVYAATKLTPVQQRIVKHRKEDNTYTCGSTLGYKCLVATVVTVHTRQAARNVLPGRKLADCAKKNLPERGVPSVKYNSQMNLHHLYSW